MIVLLEDTWEAEDIKQYCRLHNYECRELSVDCLMSYDSNEFLSCVYFCNTDIVQHHLKNLNLQHIVPNTYEEKYTEFFKRNIKKRVFGSITEDELPLFIKPTTKDKVFDGQILHPYHTFQCSFVDTFLGKLPLKDDIVYTSKVVTFVSEHRLLIGKNKLYGIGFMSGINMKDILPTKFVNKLVEITDDFRCVDVGYAKELKCWVVVEINPAFSLDDYDIDIEDYMNFCIDSCKFICTSL